MRRLPILLALVAAATGCGEQRRQAREPWVTHADTAHAFRVSYPASWQRSAASLTPTLIDPREILSVATFAARPRENGNCGHVPAGAAAEMGSGDVLLSIQERRGPGGFEDRRRPFALGPVRQGDMAACARRPDLQERFGGFRDRGRGVYVLAAFGAGASDRRREDVERVVDSLVLEPAWRSRRMRLRLQPPTGWTVKARGGHVGFGSYAVPRPPRARCALPSGARNLPDDGAYAFVFEYRDLDRAQRRRFPLAPRFSLRPEERRAYECFGDSWLFRWRDKGRAFQAHAYLGPRAGARRRAELLAALRSIVVTGEA